MGPDLGIDPGAVAKLAPDIVLASLTVPGHEQVVEGLRQEGLEVLAPEPTRLDHVYDDILSIARALGVEQRGHDLVRRMRESMTRAEVIEPPPRILVEWWPKPVIAPGRESWVTDLIELAGGQNPLGSEPVKSRPLETRELAVFDPDAIVISWCGVPSNKYRPDVVLDREGCESMRAVSRNQVYCVPEAFLGRPGPRLVEGLQKLKTVVSECRRDHLDDAGRR